MLQHILGGSSELSYIAGMGYVLFGFKRTVEVADIREAVWRQLYTTCNLEEKVSTGSAYYDNCCNMQHAKLKY